MYLTEHRKLYTQTRELVIDALGGLTPAEPILDRMSELEVEYQAVFNERDKVRAAAYDVGFTVRVAVRALGLAAREIAKSRIGADAPEQAIDELAQVVALGHTKTAAYEIDASNGVAQ